MGFVQKHKREAAAAAAAAESASVQARTPSPMASGLVSASSGSSGSGGGGGAKYPRFGKRGAPQAFPSKLYEILEGENPEIVGWTKTGRGFEVRDMHMGDEKSFSICRFQFFCLRRCSRS